MVVQFLNLVRRQAKAQITKRGGSPDASEFSRIESVGGLTVFECGRPALFSSALRAFGFELRCAELPIAGGGTRLKGRACGFMPSGRSSIAIAPRPATPASLSGAPSLRRSGG